MLNTALVIAIGGGLISQASVSNTWPDQADVLRGADTTPQIELVLDTSCSMGPEAFYSGCTASVPSCTHYYNNEPSADCGSTAPLVTMSSNDMVKAALTGCTTPTDGILDKWDDKVLFAIREFGGGRTGLLANFNGLNNHGPLETAALSLQDSGGTPMARAYAQAGKHMDSHWNAGNTETCRQNYIVLMTDGVGNGGTEPVSWITNPPLTNLTIAEGGAQNPATLAAYMFDGIDSGGQIANGLPGLVVDALTNVPNAAPSVLYPLGLGQPIRTYSIAFNAPPSAQTLLQNVAIEGDGAYYEPSTYSELDSAFTDIITNIASRSNVSFSGNTVQNDGIFADNYVYTTAFKPIDAGHWVGTARKYCVVPPDSNPALQDCIFKYQSGNLTDPLVTNTAAADMWSAQVPGFGAITQDATDGGSGRRIWADLFGISTQSDAVPAGAPYYTQRNIMTWKHGGTGYIRLNDANVNPTTGTFTPTDSGTNGACEHYSLLNKLHGYIYSVTDCAGGDYSPENYELWPQGDTMNGGSVLIKYTKTCENPGDRCYVAQVNNAGMLQFFNAYSGIETAAIVPALLWQDSQYIHNKLGDVMDQPNIDTSRRFYFDGRIRLFHDDDGGGNDLLAGDGIINNGEDAHLITGLGRGGAAYISFPMPDSSTFRSDGVPTSANNPPRPLYPDQATGFQFLRETWAAPWLGRYRVNGTDYAVAVFSNGHRRDDDQPTATIGGIQPGSGLSGAWLDTTASPQGNPCTAAEAQTTSGMGPWYGVSAPVCNLESAFGLPAPYPPPAACVASNNAPLNLFPPSPACAFSPPASGSACCYDFQGWQTLLGPWSGWKPTSPPPNQGGIRIRYGPMGWDNPSPNHIGAAYQVQFSHFDLQPNDCFRILDGAGNVADEICGPGHTETGWVYDNDFYIEFESDGLDNDPSSFPPFRISNLNYLRQSNNATGVTNPTIYINDVNLWNGPTATGAGAQGFSPIPGPGDTRQADGMLARITSTCVGSTGPNEICVDSTTNANTTDLAHMVCGIASEISVYTEGDLLSGIYFMDECGQVFAIYYDQNQLAGNAWSARRLLATNGLAGATPLQGASKDMRRGFAQLELALTQCNGSRALAVYFGTGNMQRPAAFDNLQNGTLTPEGSSHPAVSPATGTQYKDVMGMVLDHPTLPNNATLNDLTDVTTLLSLDPTDGGPGVSGVHGFYIQLLPNEKMLRRPLVLDRVLFMKTYQPTIPATECVSAEGVDRFYVMDSCTARPLADGSIDADTVVSNVSDRVAYETQSDIGGDIFLFTPKNGNPIVSHADLNNEVVAELPKRNNVRTNRLLLWRQLLQ